MMKMLWNGKWTLTAAILFAAATCTAWGQSSEPIQNLPILTPIDSNDASMVVALAGSPFILKADEKQVPTLIEQAGVGGKPMTFRAGLFRLLQK